MSVFTQVFLQEMPFHDISHNKVVLVPLKGDYERVHISSEASSLTLH